MKQQKKKIQKRIIGRAAKAEALFRKRSPRVGESCVVNFLVAKDRCEKMRASWGPLTKGPYRKPGLPL